MFITQRPTLASDSATVASGIVDPTGIVSCEEVEDHFYLLVLTRTLATMYK